ncbi:hypothetical protein ABZP36_030962 [Zizania latifolia]
MEARQQGPRLPARKRKRRDGAAAAASAASGGGNRLLAGYLAHEFLTSGTVLGERLVPGPEAGTEEGRGRAERYEAVAVLVHGGGARVPGVVNPAQLAAWARR